MLPLNQRAHTTLLAEHFLSHLNQRAHTTLFNWTFLVTFKSKGTYNTLTGHFLSPLNQRAHTTLLTGHFLSHLNQRTYSALNRTFQSEPSMLLKELYTKYNQQRYTIL